MKITVIGKGVFGKALGSLLEENSVKFSYVDIDLPMREVSDLVFLTVPTQFLRVALKENKKFFKKETVFINCSKGIEEKTHQLPFQIFKKELNYKNYYTLAGPSFAQEIMEKNPTLVSLGHNSSKYVYQIKKLVQTNYFRIKETEGLEALELAAAFKNVYAILCGYIDGLGYKINTRAKIITLALWEFAELAKKIGFKYRSLAEPAIAGDLILTCSSQESRNYRFGFYLAKMSSKEALEKVASTVEGFYTSRSIQAISKKYKASLPIALLTHYIINKGNSALPYFHKVISKV
ncbi:hypothetical protein HYS93_01535 [Candidatus Daviesbacteria bacterium]|nr:hypothetical protein [Candidatus Daviesbacteria bacterium]